MTEIKDKRLRFRHERPRYHDGRLTISLEQQRKSRFRAALAKPFQPLVHFNPSSTKSQKRDVETPSSKTDLSKKDRPQQNATFPKLNVVMHVVGSRGDVQPFLALAKVLNSPPYSHRVRLCTHPIFKDFVEGSGVEFFSIGGDPAELMSYMIKNPGLMPGIDSIRAGDIAKRRADIDEMVKKAWRSCIDPGNGMDSQDAGSTGRVNPPFVADLIIANPPSYAHIHCAEKLGIPLQMMFTMPWSPTQAFPHPLANVKSSSIEPKAANFLSYTITEGLTWQGLGDLFNDFREKTLGLDPISPLWGGSLLPQLLVPFQYCWSNALIPKPKDWGPHITISGFNFMDSASTYHPAEDLKAFLEAGPPPIYIGFGSITMENPQKTTELIYEAIARVGCRALISRGWAKLGSSDHPDNVFLLGDVPHDWLFPRVAAVVHHGGAGTTAIGLKLAKPTVVVPFFGDQPFWGSMVYRAGAGPKPIPFKMMTADSLTNSLEVALSPEAKKAAAILSEQIQMDKGVELGAQQIHDGLDPAQLRCAIDPNRVAVWYLKKSNIKLSAFAGTVLAHERKISPKDIRILDRKRWNVTGGPSDPLYGVLGALVSTATHAVKAVQDISRNMKEGMHLQHEPSSSTNLDEKRHHHKHTFSAGSDARFDAFHDGEYVLANLQKDILESRSSGTDESEDSLEDATTPSEKPRQIDSNTGAPPTDETKIYNWPTHASEPGQSSTPSPSRKIMRELGHNTISFFDSFAKLPMELTYNIANGCHNAPAFYFGDTTVRDRSRITDLKSGAQTAGKEFVLGLYDGFSGVVTQPIRGAKRKGAAGFVRGLEQGFGGLMFKTGAAVFGVPGYVLKGIDSQLHRRVGRKATYYVIASRLAEGIEAVKKSTEAERAEVLKRWDELSAARSR